MLFTKFQISQFLDSSEEDFLNGFTIYGQGGHFG